MRSGGEVALLFLFSAAVHAAEKLPPFVTRCPSRDRQLFNPCVLRNARAAIAHLGSKGDRQYGIAPVDPIGFPTVEAESNGFKLSFVNIHIKTDPPQSYMVDATDIDLDRRQLKVLYSAPALDISAKYQADGRILILPIKGQGDVSIRIEGYKANFSCHWDEVKDEKDGLVYAKFKDPEYDAQASKVIYNFTNLFNGDPTLGRATNAFLNDNWAEVFEATKWSTLEASKQLLVRQIQSFFDRVPVADAFP